jgi:hypothetical protein
MSHTVNEQDTFDPSVPSTNLNDTDYPTVVDGGLTALANRTHFIQRTLDGATGSTDELNTGNTGVFPVDVFVVPLSTRAGVIYSFAYSVISTLRFLRRSVWGATESVTFMPVPLCPHVNSDGAGNYGPPGGSLPVGGPYWQSWVFSERLAWYQIATPGGSPELYWSVRGLPPAGKIIGFNLRVKGGAGHAGLPVSMPSLGLWKQLYNGTPTLIASVSDTSPDFTNYQLEHNLTVNGLSEQIASNTNYFFKLTGESGTNKQPNYTAYECGISIGVP